ncbi:MAG: AAA family ATPase [Firmicutes bacterium]|nr:AAA family ATPase [Bacillota bacterium]
MAEPRVHIFIGPFGSGKTETAINFALGERRKGKEVSLIDLDIVNPYFRSREVRASLASFGVRVFSSAEGLEEADLPALSPGIIGALHRGGLTLVFDVGGDPAGARALGRFHHLLDPLAPAVLAVINPYRPEAGTGEAIAAKVAALAEAGRVRVTGLVANPNLGPETTTATILAGRRPIEEAAALLSLPVVFTCVREDLAPVIAAAGVGAILPLRRYMLLPWEEAPVPESIFRRK